jgi:hypothetical protein
VRGHPGRYSGPYDKRRPAVAPPTSPSKRPALRLASAPWSLLLLLFALTLVVAGCGRGRTPPRPTQDLSPSVVGVLSAAGPPFELDTGQAFPPDGSEPRRIKNWPANPAFEEQDPRPGTLLLGGQASNGSWWYELVGFGGPTSDECWPLFGGSFDDGDTIWFSSGLRVLKAPDFKIRRYGQDDVEAFPGHSDDSVCIDREGRALHFDLFVGQ